MKLLGIACFSAALVAGASFPVQADSLLGILGSKDSGALVTLGSGDAGSSGLVNLGLGGDNQVLDANVGDGGLASATVGSGGGSALDADVRLLNNNARIGVGVGGGGLLDVDIGIGGGGGDGPVPGNPGNPGNPGGGNGGILASTGGSGGNVCAGLSARELDQLIRSTRLDGSWRQASNVQIRRVDVCPDLQTRLSAALTQTGLSNSLRSAIAADPLVTASLSRSAYSVNRVFAVRQSGRDLIVFVY